MRYINSGFTLYYIYNRKMGNSTHCEKVTPKNFNLKLCAHDYVGEATHNANFGFNQYSGGF